MAVLWQHTTEAGTRYEVRAAGATKRLYTNGVFHSEWNPRRLFGGGVWDLMSLAAALRPASASTSLLMLGVGGGTVLHQVNELCSNLTADAVDIDPVHLDVAREHFGVDALPVTLHEADAITWCATVGRQFTVVIDDVFGSEPDGPERPVAEKTAWLAGLRTLTAPHGVTIVNHLDAPGLEDWWSVVAPWCRANEVSALVFTTPRYENAVVALYDDPMTARRARQRAANLLGTIPYRRRRRLAFTIRSLHEGPP